MKTVLGIKSTFGKYSVYHRIGNIIQALVNIAENLVILLTLGFLYPNWAIKWAIYRTNSRWYGRPKDVFEDITNPKDWNEKIIN